MHKANAGRDYARVILSTDKGANMDRLQRFLLLFLLKILAQYSELNDTLYIAADGKVWKRPFSDFVGITENPNLLSSVKVFPNPFTNTTHFGYKLEADAKVNLNIFDITGRLVKPLLTKANVPANINLILMHET